MQTKVKICGITREEELDMLVKHQVSYAGFVLYPPSKRYVEPKRVQTLLETLTKKDRSIQKVAVVVSPTAEEISQLETMPFQVVQIHGDISMETLSLCTKEVWIAINGETQQEIEEKIRKSAKLLAQEKVKAVLIDNKEFGSGKVFRWQSHGEQLSNLLHEQNLLFVLAGGLNQANVKQGIAWYQPDIVDVSTGVENATKNGKEERKIEAFVKETRG